MSAFFQGAHRIQSQIDLAPDANVGLAWSIFWLPAHAVEFFNGASRLRSKCNEKRENCDTKWPKLTPKKPGNDAHIWVNLGQLTLIEK